MAPDSDNVCSGSSESSHETADEVDTAPPPELPDNVVAGLRMLNESALRAASSYALSLAKAEAHNPDYFDIPTPKAASDATIMEYLLREHGKEVLNVPPKASHTVKEIRGNFYFYWQWRDTEDGKTKSRYLCPVADTPFAGRYSGSDANSSSSDTSSDDDTASSNGS